MSGTDGKMRPMYILAQQTGQFLLGDARMNTMCHRYWFNSNFKTRLVWIRIITGSECIYVVAHVH